MTESAGDGGPPLDVPLRRALDAVDELVYVFTDDGEFRYWNDTLERVTGYDAAAVASMGPTEFFPVEERSTVAAAIVRSMDEWTRVTVEAPLQTAAGDRRPYQFSCTPLQTEGDRTLFAGVGRDVTDRERARRQAAEFERRFRELAEHVDQALYLVTPDYEEVLYVNERGAEMYGVSVTDLYRDATAWLEHVHPDDRAALETSVERQREDEADWPVRQRFRVHHPEGGTRWILATVYPIRDDEGAVRRLAGISTDVTARTASERDRRFFERALDQTGHAVFITDSDATIQYVNEAFEETTGYASEEAVGRTLSLIESPTHPLPTAPSHLADLTDHGMWNAEVVTRRRDGDLFRVDLSVSKLTEDGETTNYLGVGRDVTNRVLTEARLSVLHRVLRHDVRNKLSVIRGTAARIEDVAGDAVSADVDVVRDAASELDHLSRVASDVQHHLESDPNNYGTVDVATALERQRDACERANPGATVDLVAVDHATVNAMADVGLERALQNGVVNGERPAPAVAVSVDVDRAAGWVAVTVVDDGPPVPPTDRRAIESGVETPLTHSVGLEIWALKWLTEHLGGTLSFAEREGDDVAVVVGLPVVEG